MTWTDTPTNAQIFVIWDPVVSQPTTVTWDGYSTIWDNGATQWDDGATVWEDPDKTYWVE